VLVLTSWLPTMEQSANKYFAIASIFGMHLVHTQSRLQKALHLCYISFIFVLFTPFNLYFIIKDYSDFSKFQDNGRSEGLITVNIFILIYHITLAVQLVVSFYWLLTKSQDFVKLIKRIDSFADEFSCKEQLAKHVKRLDAIFSFVVSPAMCALVVIEVSTYGTFEFKIFQLLEDCYGCTVVAIWQWKIILVASSMRVVINNLNATLEVNSIYYLLMKPVILVVYLLQRMPLHPDLVAAEDIASLRHSHAKLCNMVEKIFSLFQSIIAIASLNTFLYMVYAAYFWAIGVFDLDPSYSQKRLVVALETSGWLFFTISNYFLVVRSCELAVCKVGILEPKTITEFNLHSF
jgi:hypothetical protein